MMPCVSENIVAIVGLGRERPVRVTADSHAGGECMIPQVTAYLDFDGNALLCFVVVPV